jgi:DNA-binding winged helix-turn-helix (wHTH) protein/tetratricopeptide (TPR) repeat protein
MRLVFDEFVLDSQAYRLLRAGREVSVEPRIFELLRYLTEHSGRLVTKRELLAEVWSAQALSDGVLSNAVAKLRRALGQQVGSEYPIETLHGRGYRFCATVQVDATPEPGASAPRGSSIPVSDPFVGREGVLVLLSTRLEGIHDDSEKLVILSGEAGVGKTRTARQLAKQARDRGFSVWSGVAHDGGGAPPFWPWAQVLRAGRHERSAEEWQRCLPERAWALAQLTPELLPPGDRPAADPLAARFQLFAEITEVLGAAASARPLVVVLDDLQWADTGTLELIAFATRTLRDAPVLFVATLRTGDAARAGEGAALELLGRLAATVPLSGLSPEEVERLALAVCRDHVDIEPRQLAALHRRTQGNALFVRETLDLVVRRGDWSFVDDALPAAEQPPAIQQVIRRRVAALPAGSRSVLEAAAVQGSTFDAGVLAESLDAPVTDVLDALDPVVRLGMLEVKPTAPSTFSFAHDLTKDSLYEQLSLRDRGRLHGRLAQALSQRTVAGRPEHLGEIARHHLRAVPFDADATIAACRRAASAAIEASGFETAARLLEDGIERIQNETCDTSARVRLSIELGEARFYSGDIAGAWEAFSAAAAVARAAGDARLLAQVAPRLADCLELATGEPALVRRVVDQALADLPAEEPALRAIVLSQQAEIALELDAAARERLLTEADRLAEASGSPEAILEAAHSRAILRDPTRCTANAEAARRFLELSDRHGSTTASMRYRSLRRFGACLTLYLSAWTTGDLTGAEEAFQQCAGIARTSSVRAARFATELMRAGRALARGDIQTLGQIVSEATPDTGSPTGALEATAWAAYRVALVEVAAAPVPSPGLDADVIIGIASALTRHDPHVAIALAAFHVRVGQHDRARQLLDQIPEARFARMPVQFGDLGALCSLAEACELLGDRGRALPLYETLLPHAPLNAIGPVFESRGCVAHYLGILARQLGHDADARGHFEHAIAVNERLQMPLQRAKSERALGPG